MDAVSARGSRSRWRLCAGLAIGMAVLVVLQLTGNAGAQTGTPTRPVDHDINAYVLFGFHSVAFKGANLSGRGIIDGGNVGSNGVDPNNPTVNVCANARVTMSQGSQLVADTLRADNTPGNPCVFWDVFANRLTGGSSLGTINSGPTPVSMPVVTPPAFPTVVCNAANPVTVLKGTATVLPPGTYGAVVVQDGATLTLQPGGLYQMCSFHTGHDVTVHVVPGTEIRILQNFELDQDTVFGEGAACSARVFVQGSGVGANDNTINFSKDTTVAGHFFTLGGKLNLGNETNLFGTFWANDIISDFDVNIDYCPLLGDFPITKSIEGPGAGSQGEIQIDIVCVPSPPNGSIPPFTIPAGATGTVSTVVTGITLPAICQASETDNGANTVVVVGRSGRTALGAIPQSLGCPTLGLATGRNAALPGADLVNEYDTTTTTTGATTTTSTTTTSSTSTTSTTSSTTSTSTTSSTTEPTTTSSTESTTSTTLSPPTFPPDSCVLPEEVTSLQTTSTLEPTGITTEALPRTGGTAPVAAALVLLTGGLTLLGVVRRLGRRRRTTR